MEIHEAWEWFKRIIALLFLASVALYAVRFLATGDLMTLNEYIAFVKGLFLYLIK